jgi:hypothetical protein
MTKLKHLQSQPQQLDSSSVLENGQKSKKYTEVINA